MPFNKGDEAIYQFPLNAKKRVKGIIKFIGSTIIHFKSDEGYIIKISWKYFENIFPIEST